MNQQVFDYYNKLVRYNDGNNNPAHDKIIGKFFLDLLFKELNGEKTEFKELEDSYTKLLCKVYHHCNDWDVKKQIEKLVDFFSAMVDILKNNEDPLYFLTLPCSWETNYDFIK